MEAPLAPISAEQSVNPRLIAPYLRERIGVGIRSAYNVTVNPNKTLSPADTTYDFELPIFQQSLVDVKRMTLVVGGRLMRRRIDGTYGMIPDAAGAAEPAIVANNLVYTLFRDVTVHIGANQEPFHQPLHPYKCDIKTLLKYKDNHAAAASLQGFGVEFEDVSGYKSTIGRISHFRGSKYAEFAGETMIDLFDTPGYMKSGVPIRITYTRTTPEFYMIQDEKTKQNVYRFEISKISLQVPVIKVTETLVPEMESLCKTAPARYHFESINAKQYLLGVDTRITEFPKVFTCRIPQRLVICFYKQKTLAGDVLENPFLTSSDIKIRSLQIIHNGLVLNNIQPHFETGSYSCCYKAFLDFVGANDESYMIGK